MKRFALLAFLAIGGCAQTNKPFQFPNGFTESIHVGGTYTTCLTTDGDVVPCLKEAPENFTANGIIKKGATIYDGYIFYGDNGVVVPMDFVMSCAPPLLNVDVKIKYWRVKDEGENNYCTASEERMPKNENTTLSESGGR